MNFFLNSRKNNQDSDDADESQIIFPSGEVFALNPKKFHDFIHNHVNFKTIDEARTKIRIPQLFTLPTDAQEDFLFSSLPRMASVALRLEELFPECIQVLRRNHPATLRLSRLQVFCILANYWFCTWPEQRRLGNGVTFRHLFSDGSRPGLAKFEAIVYYFRQISKLSDEELSSRFLLYERKVLSEEVNFADSTKPLCRFLPHSTGKIEDADGCLQGDFANMFIGGGVISGGCVQEEILFSVAPELIASLLFTEVMLPNEAVQICGYQIFSATTGYAGSLSFAGPHEDHAPLDAGTGILQRKTVAFDAVDYRGRPTYYQYSEAAFVRELHKAYIAFLEPPAQRAGVATGNWGCGAFRGDLQHKAVIQWLAASEAGQPLLHYYTFQDRAAANIDELTALPGDLTVGQLYRRLQQYEADSAGLPPYSFWAWLTAQLAQNKT